MQSTSGAKNPPWARPNVNANITGINPQIMDPNTMMTQQGMMPFQQTQTVFNPSLMQAQSGMAMPMAGQIQMTQSQMYPSNVVAYPSPRGMNPGLYQSAQATQGQQGTDQRVFTGTVTKTHNDFGFVDHDVFYQTSVCAKGVIPKVNDRVLVEATYNTNMPFKWNATRVQVLPKSSQNNQKTNTPKSNSYNAVPPPSSKKPLPTRRDDRSSRRDDRKRSRTRSRSRSRDRRDSRNRRDSPPRKRPLVHQSSPLKYVVRVPRIPLDIDKADVPGLSQRYNNLYIPSDFFNAHVKWGETFPPQAPFSLNNPCTYHIMSKEIENPSHNDTILEPADADYRFSAKVMLISMPTLESLYQKCGLTKVDEKDKRSSKSPLHPTRLIKFLVGQKGKGGENFAIGGPWSPSLDGENPHSDPGVLVKTAIRTCKALTGIDLSTCTQWYRVVEFYYWREGSGGKSRLECVVLFLPDVWSAQPSRIEWTSVQERYKAACEANLRRLDGVEAPPDSESDASKPFSDDPAEKSQIDKASGDDSTITIDENDEEDDVKPEPTHHSKIDLRAIKIDQLKRELRARNASLKGQSTGLRAQLVSRLSKLLNTEKEKDGNCEDVMELEDDEADKHRENTEQLESEDQEVRDESDKNEEMESDTIATQYKNKSTDTNKLEEMEITEKEPKTEKELEEERKKLEKEKQSIKSRYELPSSPHIIVHPSNVAKNGKFNCSVATLSLLLDYRITDNKEHSFELFVFAELFNEMLMRDFGFYIYKTLYTLPEITDEVKEKDKSEDKCEKKDDKKVDDKKEEKNNDKDKKDDKDRREARRRDRKESHSDDERSSSPKRKGRGVELPPDPYLLLSLVYFDTSRCGNITKKNLQNLFMSLGLQLSRSQIRSILEKVCVKDTFNYKTLIQAIKDVASGTSEVMQDLPLDTAAAASEVPSHISELEETIAAGNRELLPIFGKVLDEDGKEKSATTDVSETGMVLYKSRVIDVGALVEQAAKAAGERARLESALENTKAALKVARAAAASTQQAERGAQSQLNDLNAQFVAAKARLTSLMASSKIFHSTLKSIQSKVEAVVNIKYDDDDVVEIVNGPSKDDKQKLEDMEKEKEVKKTLDSQIESREERKSIDNSSETEDMKGTDLITSENMDLDDKE